MSNDSSQHEAARFMGAVIASVSHDLNNVLSTIDQVAGLIEDMMMASERGIAIDPSRLELVHARLDSQAKRGINTVRRLNTFGHAIDEETRCEQPVMVLQTLLVLMERMASRRQVEIDFDPEQSCPQIETHPLDFYHLLYLALLLAMDSHTDGGMVRVSVEPVEDRVSILIEGKQLKQAPGAGERIQIIHEVAKGLEAEVVLSDKEPDAIELVLPHIVPADER